MPTSIDQKNRFFNLRIPKNYRKETFGALENRSSTRKVILG
jgi:hypothetical protein